MVYLVILLKGLLNYCLECFYDCVMMWCNWVFGEMLCNGFIDQVQYDVVVVILLGIIFCVQVKDDVIGGYFIEEVCCQLIGKFGENVFDGFYLVYVGGLWVCSLIDLWFQNYVEIVLCEGLLCFDYGCGWSGLLGKVDILGNW